MDRPRRTPRRSTTAAAPPPPATPYVRPQQPADSPAASLPTETLKQIFDYATAGMKADREQAARYALGRVALHWWNVSEVNKRVVVKSSQEAESLAKAIHSSSNLKGQMEGLMITIEGSGAGRGQRVADLLKLTPKLRVLVLQLTEGSKLGVSGDDEQLGKPVYQALRTLKDLHTVALGDKLRLTENTLFGLLECWPSLKELCLPGLMLQLPDESEPRPDVPSTLPSLAILQVPLGRLASNSDIVKKLVKASKGSLRTLRLGKIPTDPRLPSPNDFAFSESALRRLHTLEIIDERGATGSSYLETLLGHLKAVRTLTLGVNGHDSSTLFDRLSQLSRLRSFTLRYGKSTSKHVLRAITADAVVRFLQRTPKLRHLRLPKSFRDRRWTLLQGAEVRIAAQEARVTLTYL